MQQNSRCRLWVHGHETINHTSKCSNLTQKKYKTRHDWEGKIIHWELCQKLKFDHMNKWYMYNPESVLENETQTPLGFWDTNGSPNLGQTTRPCNNKQQKRTCRTVDFAVLVDHRVKLKESKKKDKYLDFARKLKKLWSMKVMVVAIGALGTVTKGLVKGQEDLEIRGWVETHSNYRITEISQNSEKNLGDLRSLKLQWETIG